MKVFATYFTGTGTTKKVVEEIAQTIANKFAAEYIVNDFTLPKAREEKLSYGSEDVVVFGVPVIAGRVPNVLLKYLNTIEGNGAIAIPIVLFGNRNFDDALIELRDILEDCGLKTIAAGAFVGEHSFSKKLAKGRPDSQDMRFANMFGRDVAKKIEDGNLQSPIKVDGVPKPYRGYYQPRDRKGTPIDIRKVKPKTNDNCIDCKLCADICPMGSISVENVKEFVGICIKCCACIKSCPQEAKYYDDEGYLYHQHELEDMYERRAEPIVYI